MRLAALELEFDVEGARTPARFAEDLDERGHAFACVPVAGAARVAAVEPGAGIEQGRVDEEQLAEIESRDNIFAELDYRVYRSR